jgi:hypothetical protein
MDYLITLVKDPQSNGLRRAQPLVSQQLTDLGEKAIGTFGAFYGVFGLATNEMYVVTYSEDDQSMVSEMLGSELEVRSSVLLVPTTRPVTHAPRDRDGLYVFRWFDVHNRDVDEIVKLSDDAWPAMEQSFDCEIQGLFAEKDRSAETGKMILCTRYASLDVWQQSRDAPEESSERFRRRHELTLEATPIATRLMRLGR